VFQRFHFSESHTDRKTSILADSRLCLGSAAAARFFEGALDNRFQVFWCKTQRVARRDGHGHLQLKSPRTPNRDSTDLSDSMRNMTTTSETDDSGGDGAKPKSSA